MNKLLSDFKQYFDIIPANSQQLVTLSQQLRYKIFCVEHKILPSERHDPKALESDHYDTRSVHTLLQHRSSGEYTATVRLVLPIVSAEKCTFPLEENMPQLNQHERALITKIPRTKLAEISRFAVSKQFRRRAGEAQVAHGMSEDFGQPRDASERRFDAHISLGLFKSIVQMSTQHNVHHWCAFMEPSLMRLLARMGIRFTPVGPLVKYCGLRHACYENVAQILSGIKQMRPDVWEFITEETA